MSGSDESARVIARSGEVASATEGAAQWIEQHDAMLRQDSAALARELRRHGRRAARLHEAAKRPMCVAVFGASQVGKSYLVSRLAAVPGRPLAARFGRETFDFLTEINPPGGQEATGLVTRFTTRPPPALPGAPVTLRLLSELDLVRILANSYLEDFDIEPAPVNATELERLFAALSASARPQGGAPSTGDIEDLAEYFDRHFRNHSLLAQVNALGYWPRAAELASQLSVAERASLFAPLWGGTTRLTALFRQLTEALAAIGYPGVAYCGTDALVPRENSIIDAQRLFDIGSDRSSGNIDVTTQNGSRIALNRSVLAALVAELTFPLAERPWPFFDTTDLLDFPGARTRESITDIEKFLAQPKNLGHAFLRGKVAYLFQRYNAEQEITSMLLCVGTSTQEVRTLPRMVQDWIHLTLGETPAKRAGLRNSLFLVLTKFDEEFQDRAGEDPASGHRWTARIQASLLDFFGKAYDWPTEWAPKRPFDNVFWLRNPAIGFGAVFDYGPPSPDGVAPELGVSPRASAAVAVKRAAYLANALVSRHIAEPAAAWDSGLAPNDGGISRLAGALGPVCDPTLKATQVGARVEDLALTLADRLRPLWRSDDRVAELTATRARTGPLLRALAECASVQMFGALLRALQITTEQVAGVHWHMQTEPDSDTMAPIGAASSAVDLLQELGSLGLLGAAEEAPVPSPARLDYFEHFAGRVIAAWDETLQALAADAESLAAYRLPAEQAGLLVAQLAAAARRIDLRGRIATSLRRLASFHGRATASAGKSVLIAEDHINEFVAHLGFDQIPEASRPTVGAVGPGQRRVFAARQAASGLPTLGPLPTPYDRTFYIDWMMGFARLMEDNVTGQTDYPIDPAANEAIGAILRRFAR